MKNIEKKELRQIIRSIPISECNKKITYLWKEYGDDFTYGTFRQYFKIFNKLNGITKLNTKELGIPPKPKVLGILPNFI